MADRLLRAVPHASAPMETLLTEFQINQFHEDSPRVNTPHTVAGGGVELALPSHS